MNITHPHEAARLRAVIARYELARSPEWLAGVAAGVNPYPYADERHEPTQAEIERIEMVRARRRQRNG